MRPRHALLALAGLALGIVLGCGDEDDPVQPPPVIPGIGVPEDAATLAEALVMADPGDTISLAPGVHAGAVTIERSVTILGRSGGAAVILDTDEGPLAVTATADSVRLADLTIGGGQTALVATLAGCLAVERCVVRDARLGLRGGGDDGEQDCKLVISGTTFSDLGSGPDAAGAVILGDDLAVEIVDCVFRDCAGAGQAVVELQQGAAVTLTGTRFVDCAAGAAGLIRTAGLGALSLDTIDFHDCASPLVTVNTEETVSVRRVTVRSAVATAADAALFQVGSWSAADLAQVTVVDSPCAVLAFGYYAHVRFTWSIAVAAQTPAVRIPGSEEPWELTLEHVDLWDPDDDAWAGLEDWVDGTGNLTVDPLFCDAPGADYRLQPATPCPGYGAHGVGCD